MNIRQIKAETVTETVKQLFLDCNYFIGKDIMTALENARENEKSEVGKSVLTQIIENDKLAAKEEVPLCQDTGMAILFVEYGDKVVIEDGSFEDAVNEGVRQAYKDGYLRKSVVNDPVFDRLNTKDNTPAIIHTRIVKGDKIKITAGGKGFGSENMSAIKMLTPSYGIEGVKKFILDTIRTAGPNPCPPIVVGVGIGGTFERCAQLAKKATFRAIDTHNEDERYAKLEDELLESMRQDTQAQKFKGERTMPKKLTLPLSDEDIKNLKAGESVLLSGTMLTGRDAAHKRLFELIEKGENLPVDIKGEIIYYVGPAPAKPGYAVGPAGPTSSYRMDKYAPALLDLGLKGMVGKGARNKEVIDAIVRNGCVYFAAIGGAAALIAKSIKKEEMLCYEDLGTEAVRRYTVEDFPCIVAIDSKGNNVYETEPKKYNTEA